MIVVRVELWSANTLKKTELARMELCNDGTGTHHLRNYIIRSFKGRSKEDLDKRHVARGGEIKGHASESYHVWVLVAKALTALKYA